MEKWVLPAIASLVMWGLWGVVIKLASEGRHWAVVYVGANTAALAASLIVALHYKDQFLSTGLSGVAIAFLAGVFGTLGYLFLIYALGPGRGKGGVVIALTALYPAVTAVLAWLLLGEHLSLRQAIGIAMAVTAVVFLST